MPYTYDYPMPAVTVDAAVLRKTGNSEEILLIRRRNDPFRGMWALPGGFVDIDEELDDAVIRELHEETGIENCELRQLFTVGTVGRDPRGRIISVIFAGWYNGKMMEVNAGDDASDVGWFDCKELPPLAFDHMEVIAELLQIIHKEI